MNRSGIGIFLDRDGTINEEVDYLTETNQLELLPNSAEAIKKFNSLGLPVFVVTNQSAIARNLLTEEKLSQIHDTLQKMLNNQNAKVTKFYYCPHLANGENLKYSVDCNCRKPKTGLLEIATKEFTVDLSKSFFIGDKLIDVQTGIKAGMTTFLVETGYGLKSKNENPNLANFIVKDLLEASQIIEKKMLQE